MKNGRRTGNWTRRELLQLTTAGASALGVRMLLPDLTAAAQSQASPASNPYSQLMRTWCDGLLAYQVSAIQDPGLHGALLCPACGIIHGRCADAIYPMLHMAHATGDAKYLQSALALYEWSEQQVSRADGSWINDVTLGSWQGITVFHSIALAEALHHHGAILDRATRQRWTDRLARAAKFLDGFITIETGNINYPVTSSLCFALCAEVLGEPRYQDRARKLAHAALEYFSENNFLCGEGHPSKGISKKGCRPVDLGYNVEESLPALAQYALLTHDQEVLDKVVAAMRTHMQFMLPDGGWDNSWGTRNYKWSWWGSRTSDGCQPFLLLSQHDPKFREVAQRNLELMSSCTHDGLLYGGPHYFEHGDRPCIHHTFSHAKALATVLDRGGANLALAARQNLPREEATGIQHYPEIGLRLASIGPWRATVTEYDWEYVEHVWGNGNEKGGGGSATGGALSCLFHRNLGPLLVASMTEYQIIEVSNQQVFGDYPHMTLTPRVECRADRIYTSLSDLEATVVAANPPGALSFDVHGRLQTAGHQPLPTGEVLYHLRYHLTDAAVTIQISTSGTAAPAAPLQFILPVISLAAEKMEQPVAGTVRITKPKGMLLVQTDAKDGFAPVPQQRTFNLVPGFECVPIIVPLQLGQEISITLETAGRA